MYLNMIIIQQPEGKHKFIVHQQKQSKQTAIKKCQSEILWVSKEIKIYYIPPLFSSEHQRTGNQFAFCIMMIIILRFKHQRWHKLVELLNKFH